MKITKDITSKICRQLLKYDPNIEEIIQFGSSVYAPEHAKDLDLLVLTEKAKDYSGYLDCLDMMDLPFDVDVVVKEPQKPLDRVFGQQVRGAYQVLYGAGVYLQRSPQGDPSFEDSGDALEEAYEDLKIALSRAKPTRRDRRIRAAFNGLFDAARIASMAYLPTDETRWGQVRKKLPQPYRGEFESYIRTLHIKYFYDGNYPKETVDEEFEKWYARVGDYIKRLESDFARKGKEG